MKGAPSRRRALRTLGVAALGAGLPALRAQTPPRTIEIVARYFSFSPNEISIAAGERVLLSVTSMDYTHGMSFPDLGLRVDLVPGRAVRLELPPQRPGRYSFLCDNFCGDDHEDMHGRLVVQDPA